MEKNYFEPADFKVYVKGKGVVINEKTLLVYNKETNRIQAIGKESLQLIDENRPENELVSAFHQGTICNYTCAEKMIKYFLGRAGMKRHLLGNPDVVVCVPDNSNEVDKKACEDAVYQAGARHVYIKTDSFESVIQSLDQPEMGIVRYVIGITKDEPELYIKEALSEVLEAARKQGLDKEWVKKLLEESY